MSESLSPMASMVTRRNLLLATFAAFIAAFFWFAGASAEIAIARLLSDGLVVVAWLLSAAGYGAAILSLVDRVSPARCERPLLRACLSIAIGIGAIGFITLGLGLLGQLNLFVAWAILGIGVLCFAARYARRIRHVDRRTIGHWLKQQVSPIWIPMVASGALIGITCIAALAPPGLLWGDEPNGYDVVEYHLQVPREWFEVHHIVPLTHNVFSYFPQGMEIHYLLAMHLCGGPWAGMYVAQLMHAATIGLTVLSVIALMRERSTNAGVLGGLSMLASPWLLLLAPVAYVEGLMLLNATLAIGLSVRAIGSVQSKRDCLLAGAFAGLACGAKLTAAPMLVGAIAGAFVVDSTANKRRATDAAKRVSIFLIASLVVASPWLTRNVAWTHNPVFPEMTTVFGNGNGRFSIDQIERWHRANHEPAAALQSLRGHVLATRDQVLFDWRYGFILFPLAIAAFASRQRIMIYLATLLGLMLVFWFGFTHLQSRFFVLAIPVVALAIAHLDRSKSPVAIAGVLLVFTIAGAAQVIARYASNEKVLATITANRLLGVEQLDPLTRVDLSNVDEHQRVTLVGDAGAFWYLRPMSTLRYRTVFDAGSIPSDWLQAWVDERRAGEVIVVSPAELERLSRTYWKVPRPPLDVVERGGPYLMR